MLFWSPPRLYQAPSQIAIVFCVKLGVSFLPLNCNCLLACWLPLSCVYPQFLSLCLAFQVVSTCLLNKQWMNDCEDIHRASPFPSYLGGCYQGPLMLICVCVCQLLNEVFIPSVVSYIPLAGYLQPFPVNPESCLDSHRPVFKILFLVT